MRVLEAGGGLIRDGWGRFRREWGWWLGEYIGLAVLIALGLVWTRIPEKTGWQVALTFALPVAVTAGFLWLQAGFIRGFLPPGVDVEETEPEEEDEEAKWAPIAWGAATLLIWVVIGWVLWRLLDSFDDHIWGWAAYLNSKFGPNLRSRWASYENLQRELSWAAWALRWVIVPGLLIPLGVGSAAWGLFRLPWRRALRLWVSWKWWPVIVVWAWIGEWWPRTWFEAEPHGTVQSQVWRVMLKLAGAYLLAVTAWVKVLGWGAMLVNPRPRNRMDEAILTLGLGARAGAAARDRESDEEEPAEPTRRRRAVLSLDLGAPPSPPDLAPEDANAGEIAPEVVPSAQIAAEDSPPAEITAEVLPPADATAAEEVEKPGTAPEEERPGGLAGRPLPRGGEGRGRKS